MSQARIKAVQTLHWQSFWSPGDAGIHVMRVSEHGETGMHDHVFREIVYVESGTAEHLTAAGEPRQLRPGDLIVIRPMVWHAYKRPRRFGIINCLFDQHMMRRLAPLLEDVDGAFELYRRPSARARDEAPVVLHVRPSQRPALFERLERILAEQQQQASGWQAAATAALLDVLVTAARLHRHQLAGETKGSGPFCRNGPKGAAHKRVLTPFSPRVEQAVQDTVTYLESNYTQPIRLDDLAQRAGVSPAHLCRNFGRRMGVGIVEFVHQLRCEEACRLLRCTDESIGRVAGRVGYDEVAYFSRRFRRQTGRSPRQYVRAGVESERRQ